MSYLTPLILAAALGSPVAAGDARPASCTVPNRAASIVENVDADYPEIARNEQITGTAAIRVTLSERGNLLSTQVEKTSGSPILDAAALRAVKEVTYAPEIVACTPITGSYIVDVSFP